jgi:hypothetical protein
MKRVSRWVPVAVLAVSAGLLALPAAGVGTGRDSRSGVLSHLSQGVQQKYFLTHPAQAPAALEARFEAVRQAVSSRLSGSSASSLVGNSNLFNDDDLGLPQNEESVTVCKKQPSYVLGGTNDYRGLLDPEFNFTGWYFSQDGGRSVANEGLLPAIEVGSDVFPSGGDPVSASDENCNLYAASLNYLDPFEGVNGIGLYKTTPKTLLNCPQGEEPDHLTNPSCWPKRKIIARANVVGGVGQFLDKEWMDVGKSGSAGKVVWVAYSDFAFDVNEPLGFSGAQIKAVRCDAALNECTEPILISGTDQDIQFADVTMAADGSTLITWAQIEGELEQERQTFTIKAVIAPPGSTEFGPTRVVAVEENPLQFGAFLHANDFRTATYPKSIMPIVDGKLRPFVVWDRCRDVVNDTVCEEPQILMSWSKDEGTTWTAPKAISAAGDNYFPAISDEVGSKVFVVGYYTNRFDPIFHNRQDVELVTIGNAGGNVTNRQRVTSISNETEADPVLGGFFIGDYFDVHLLRGRVWVHYNANTRHVRLLGEGIPIPQQDNFLRRVEA